MFSIIGAYHLIIAFVFVLSTFLIDLDHKPFNISEAIHTMLHKCNPGECQMHRGFLHHPLTFYIFLAITLGIYIHFKMDGIL